MKPNLGQFLVEIGNTDNRLTQKEWSEYIRMVDFYIRKLSQSVYFVGYSAGNEQYQNAAWHFSQGSLMDIKHLRRYLNNIRVEFNQDAIAWSATIPDWIIDNPIQM